MMSSRLTPPVRIPSSTRLPPSPDRSQAVKTTRIERIWLVFACVNLLLVAWFVWTRVDIHCQKRALERQMECEARLPQESE
ncbi:MAG: hypothetical protein IJS32_05140 [Kiritimatiellae bacterium]|nr:hypothetical protein [Kiritimatiellia bacterium]